MNEHRVHIKKYDIKNMMNFYKSYHRKLLLIIIGIILILVTPVIIYFSRSPVLVVTDFSSIPLYGKARISRRVRSASFALFRRVITVPVADDAAADIVRFAAEEAHSSPNCVIFPYRFARASRLYHENNPGIPVILLQGRYNADENIPSGSKDGYFIYKTDINHDFKIAGVIACALDTGINGKIAVFLDQSFKTQAENALLGTLGEYENPPEAVFFASYSEFYEIPDLSFAILAGEGIGFFENQKEIPVILFTWIDPYLLPKNTAAIIDDSPWVQITEAVRAVRRGEEQVFLKSGLEIINGYKIEKRTLRKIGK